MHYKIENQASSQQIKETKPHVSVDVKEKITKQSSTSVKIDTSRMPNSENHTNRILAVEPSNRHILVKILQFLYSNSSDPTSLETIKQEILSTTSKDQQIIIFDILAAYLGGTPPDNSYLQTITKAESKRARREVFTFNRSPSSRIHTAMAPRDKTTEDHSMTSKRQQ